MGREERELVRAGGRACGALGLDFSKLGELQRILELEWGWERILWGYLSCLA